MKSATGTSLTNWLDLGMRAMIFVICLKLLPYVIGLVMYFFVWLGSGN